MAHLADCWLACLLRHLAVEGFVASAGHGPGPVRERRPVEAVEAAHQEVGEGPVGAIPLRTLAADHEPVEGPRLGISSS